MTKTMSSLLCTLLAIGLAVSALPAQDREKPDVVQEERASTIKELTIRNSGFRSRATITIRYRDEDKKIVEVIENGKKLPPEEFPQYESVMRKILELPEIDRLLPDIERARRLADSPRISEESKIREMLELRRRLERLDSDVARRYRDINEFQLMNELNSLSEKISESSDLSQEEKIQQLKEILVKIQAMEFEKVNEDRRRRLAEIEAANVATRLMAEIEKSEDLSHEEKMKAIQELLQKSRVMDLKREEERHRDMVEFEAANTIRKMLQEIRKNENLSDREREKEIRRILDEARKLRLETATPMIGIEEFKIDLRHLLKEEGLLPEGKAEFVLRMNESTIDGKKLPKAVHERIMNLCEQDIGKKFDRGTKIVLQLNEDR
jgi:hypothetical protein